MTQLKSWGVLFLGVALFSLVLGLLFLGIYPFLPLEYQAILSLLQSSQNPQDALLLIEQFSLRQGVSLAWVFLILQILQVLFAPIPGQLIGWLGGYVFGFWGGLSLSLLGLALGSGLAMLMGRFLGQTLLQRFVPPLLFESYESLIDKGGVSHFFILFLLPAFPDDALCFLAGVSRLPLMALWIAAILGRLPGMGVLSYLGAYAKGEYTLFFLLGLGSMGLILLFFEESIQKIVQKYFPV